MNRCHVIWSCSFLFFFNPCSLPGIPLCWCCVSSFFPLFRSLQLIWQRAFSNKYKHKEEHGMRVEELLHHPPVEQGRQTTLLFFFFLSRDIYEEFVKSRRWSFQRVQTSQKERKRMGIDASLKMLLLRCSLADRPKYWTLSVSLHLAARFLFSFLSCCPLPCLPYCPSPHTHTHTQMHAFFFFLIFPRIRWNTVECLRWGKFELSLPKSSPTSKSE